MVLAVILLAVAVFVLQLRGHGVAQCPDRVVILRGRTGTPLECICIDGVLVSCFQPGA